jgi:hypothetical protein
MNTQLLEYGAPCSLAIDLAPPVAHAARPRRLEQLDLTRCKLCAGEQQPPRGPVRTPPPNPTAAPKPATPLQPRPPQARDTHEHSSIAHLLAAAARRPAQLLRHGLHDLGAPICPLRNVSCARCARKSMAVCAYSRSTAQQTSASRTVSASWAMLRLCISGSMNTFVLLADDSRHKREVSEDQG